MVGSYTSKKQYSSSFATRMRRCGVCNAPSAARQVCKMCANLCCYNHVPPKNTRPHSSSFATASHDCFGKDAAMWRLPNTRPRLQRGCRGVAFVTPRLPPGRCVKCTHTYAATITSTKPFCPQ